MIPLGMALVWAGYGVGLYGWVLIRGYNVTFTELFSPTSYLKKPIHDWPKIPQGSLMLLPSGKSAPKSSAQPGGTSPPTTAI